MRDRRGFTLVEMIATITVLGILSFVVVTSIQIIQTRLRLSYYEKQEDLITLAGKSYFGDHRSLLPKEDGVITTVSINDLIENKYIDPVNNYKGELCNSGESSGFVGVQKQANGEYKYLVYLSCPEDDYTDKTAPTPPTITHKLGDITIAHGTDPKVEGKPSGVKGTYHTITRQETGDILEKDNPSLHFSLEETGFYIVTAYTEDFQNKKSSVVTKSIQVMDLECEKDAIEGDKCHKHYDGQENSGYQCPVGTQSSNEDNSICYTTSNRYCESCDDGFYWQESKERCVAKTNEKGTVITRAGLEGVSCCGEGDCQKTNYGEKVCTNKYGVHWKQVNPTKYYCDELDPPKSWPSHDSACQGLRDKKVNFCKLRVTTTCQPVTYSASCQNECPSGFSKLPESLCSAEGIPYVYYTCPAGGEPNSKGVCDKSWDLCKEGEYSSKYAKCYKEVYK